MLQTKKTLWCCGGGFDEALVDVKIYYDKSTQNTMVIMEDNPNAPETYVGCAIIIDEVIAKIAFVFEINPKKTKWIHIWYSPTQKHISKIFASGWKQAPSVQFSNLKVRKISTPQSVYWVKSNSEDIQFL